MRTNIAAITRKVLMTEAELCRWVGAATPGDRLIYHRGGLCRDREKTTAQLDERERAELHRAARRAFSLAQDGLVHVAQHRHGPDDYTYFLIARPKPQSKRGLLLTLLPEPPKRDF